MIPNRVSTAQIADELLNEFYVKSNFEKSRKKHQKRVKQKLLQGIDNRTLNEVQYANLSQSLESLPTQRQRATLKPMYNSSLEKAGGLRSNNQMSKSVSFDSNTFIAVPQYFGDDGTGTGTEIDALNTSALDLMPSMNQDKIGQVADMMQRVTFQKQEDEDNVLVAANAREVQYEALQDSAVMQQVMREILDLNNEVNDLAIESRAGSTMDVAGRLELCNSTYIRLFEKMLAETLLIQRSKFKNQTKRIQELKALLAEMTVNELEGRDGVKKAADEVQLMELEVAAVNRRFQLLQEEYDKLQSMYAQVDQERKLISAQLKEKEGALSGRELNDLINRIRQEEKQKYMKESQLLRKQMEKDMQKRIQEEAKKVAESSKGPSLAELTTALKSTEKPVEFKRPKVSSETQTEVDENGVWDRQDGWTLPITGTYVARARWRKAGKFAGCPSCKGIGRYIGLVARLLREMMRGGGNAFVDEDKKPKGVKGTLWQIPDDMVRFIANIPRSAQAISPKPTQWVLRRIWILLEKKFVADTLDDSQGLPIQDLIEFLVESYLIRSEKRSEAELSLYTLVQSMKETYQRHPLIHTFARFVGLLDGYTVEEMKKAKKEKEERDEEAREKKKKAMYKKMSARDRTAHARKEEDDRRDKELREQGKAVEEERLGLCDASLSLGILSVYNYARSCLLEDYSGVYARKIKRNKAQNENLIGNEIKLNKEIVDWGVTIPAHICVDSKFQFYVPLDRALRVVQCIISFAEEKQYSAALRSLEHAVVFLLPDGEIRLPEGMHTLTRSAVREFLSCDSEDGADMSNLDVYNKLVDLGKIPARNEEEKGPVTEEVLEGEREILLTNLDVALRICCECLLYRSQYVEKKLADIFVEGDENKDGVLSYQEFMTIVSKVAPHFSDRRILRMYREALAMGDDADTISPFAFVQTCKKHGLVSLVDLREMKTGSLRALSKSDEQKKKEQQTKTVLEQMKANPVLFQSGFKSPTDRAQARRMSSINSMSRKSSLANLNINALLTSVQAGSSNKLTGLSASSPGPQRKASSFGLGQSPNSMKGIIESASGSSNSGTALKLRRSSVASIPGEGGDGENSNGFKNRMDNMTKMLKERSSDGDFTSDKARSSQISIKASDSSSKSLKVDTNIASVAEEIDDEIDSSDEESKQSDTHSNEKKTADFESDKNETLRALEHADNDNDSDDSTKSVPKQFSPSKFSTESYQSTYSFDKHVTAVQRTKQYKKNQSPMGSMSKSGAFGALSAMIGGPMNEGDESGSDDGSNASKLANTEGKVEEKEDTSSSPKQQSSSLKLQLNTGEDLKAMLMERKKQRLEKQMAQADKFL